MESVGSPDIFPLLFIFVCYQRWWWRWEGENEGNGGSGDGGDVGGVDMIDRIN